jgi:hypothetical protein
MSVTSNRRAKRGYGTPGASVRWFPAWVWRQKGNTSARKIFLAIAFTCLVAACGQSPLPETTPIAPQSSTGATLSATSAAATAPAVAAGCGIYCQQAGNSAGEFAPGYPCPKNGCRRCPLQSCVSLESRGATAANGVATVRLSCNLPTACHGAFLICLPLVLCNSGWTGQGAGGRLAASDFVVTPGTTSDVGVALTTLGKQVVSSPGGFRATVLVDLLDYGIVLNTTDSEAGNFSLTSTDPPTLPSGATASCGSTVFVGPDTSCPFAENVGKSYSESVGSGNAIVRAVSPVTGQTYSMRCTGGSPHVCRDRTNALVIFYS